MANLALGIHTGHDRGAAIVQDGRILAAISQERLDRVKHSRSYAIPYNSIDALLDSQGLTIQDIGCVGFSGDAIDASSVAAFLRQDFWDHYHKVIPFYPVKHHDSHAYSAYITSGFQDSLILVADGGGDYVGNMTEAESLYLGTHGNVIPLESRMQHPVVRRMGDYGNYLYPYMPQVVREREISISRKYEQITYLLGFGWGQAGKTMGLASYGVSLMDFSVRQSRSPMDYSLQYGDILDVLYAVQQHSGANHFDFLENRRADIARTIQEYTETTMVTLVTGLLKKYQLMNICVAGGLFLNCLLNHLILERCPVENAFFFPAAGDDGQAIGNALFAYSSHFGVLTPTRLETPYLGLSYTDEEIERVLCGHSLNYQKLDEQTLAHTLAKKIFENRIIALHRGRTEIGPRALCHRSIMANPTSPNMKDILNDRVKHREAFRPFAPVVTAERQFDIFELKQESPYMLLAPHVKEAYRERLPSITHVDGTARVQSVTYQQEPFIHTLLSEFEQISGLPVLLNTSFNVAGEPIVESPEDAVTTFLKTQIDVLCIGNYLVTKEISSRSCLKNRYCTKDECMIG